MATAQRKKMIREATSSVQGSQGDPKRAPVTRATSAPATGPSRVGARSQQQGGPKLNELRGKVARLEKERIAQRDRALEEIAQIEALLGLITMTAFSVVTTATRVAEILTHCDALRKTLS